MTLGLNEEGTRQKYTYQIYLPKTKIYLYIYIYMNACSRDCFTIVDTARTKHQLRIKESLFISWLKLTLNKQKSHQYIISLPI